MIQDYKRFWLGFFCGLGIFYVLPVQAQGTTWSLQMTETAMNLWPAGVPSNWNYEQGVVMTAVEQVYEKTAEAKYLQYIQGKVDYFVGSSGRISTYSQGEYNLDHIASGRALLFLHQQTALNKYKLAADHLRDQLRSHPRTVSNGFWHKNIYPNQMWLDGLYMAQPFYAKYSTLYDENINFDDIAHQFLLMNRKALDPQTGLLYHGWDESIQQAWANPSTGCSPSFWGRAMGWYAMGLVDVLDHMPKSHTQRDSLVTVFKALAQAIVQVQDEEGLWWQVPDKQGSAGNYREASASCMFVYALAKGVHQGYLEDDYWQKALKGYQGILNHFVSTDPYGRVHLRGTCMATGLGGSPRYRDGSYGYYTSVAQGIDDARGVGPFIMASLEIEQGLTTTHIDEKTFKSKIYPNPFTDILQLPISIEGTYMIWNTYGQLIYSDHAGSQIDTQQWPAGCYRIALIEQQRTINFMLIKK